MDSTGADLLRHDVEVEQEQPCAGTRPPQNTVSNLTKHLMSSSNSSVSGSIDKPYKQFHPRYNQEIDPQQQQQQPHSFQLHFQNYLPHQPTLQLQYAKQHYQSSSSESQNSAIAANAIPFREPFQQNSVGAGNSNGSVGGGFHGPMQVPMISSYIPSTHNTPTMVNSSYSSNHSYTPSQQVAGIPFVPLHYQTLQQQKQQQAPQQLPPSLGHLQFTPGSSYKPMTLTPVAPTTNISMDSANVVSSSGGGHKSYNNSPFDQRVVSSLSHSVPAGSTGYPTSALPSFTNRLDDPSYGSTSSNIGALSRSTDQQINLNVFSEPDHYMTYSEFLESLNRKDAQAAEAVARETGAPTSPPEEHLNITDYPMNDLIMMLSCLLSKIVEANDKLHPNHFDNTIAVRQKTKEEKRLRKLKKLRYDNGQVDDGHSDTQIDSVDENSLDEEDDEMKNKYLANVLAFHGKNVPGISLHAYLTRVLKYCPVTSDVFLSLLVYFDRIAKKANNLRKKKECGEGFVAEGEPGGKDDDASAEQLFVMDSYNIHRLIISGITVSSKFFSDIFYKNLRYAKVGGLPLEELNYLELQFLLLLDFKLMISVEDLQNYGDLLLRFWKREQVANELASSTADELGQAHAPQGQLQQYQLQQSHDVTLSHSDPHRDQHQDQVQSA